MAKFQIRSPFWDRLALFGSIVLIVVGLGALFVLRAIRAPALLTLLFVVGYGLVTFALFAGPGIVFVARKRIPAVKRLLPGGTLAWVRSHLYLPILALVAAWVHASVVPFRTTLSSGKLLLAVGIVVSLAGVARHRLIGIQKGAVNNRAAIAELTAGRRRPFRRLVQDYLAGARPEGDIRSDVASLPADEQELFGQVVERQERIDQHFPRAGGQRPAVRVLKVARALHAPLTVVLFVLLVFHVWDVFDAEDTVLGDDKSAFASAQSCGQCHGDIYEQWASSAMSHAQTSTIMVAQLPVTLAKNAELASLLGPAQRALFESGAPTCINCHSPVGGRFVEEPEALLPLDAAPPGGEAAVAGGGAAVHDDGVACIACHTHAEALGELRGLAPLDVPGSGLTGHGTMFGPELSGGDPLPVWVHGIDTGPAWSDSVAASVSCGACHNVKLDLDGDGLSPRAGFGDADGDFQLDENELDDDDGLPGLDDLILQTTFDEWQDYLAGFRDRVAGQSPVARPMGCVDCHMPIAEGERTGAVDYAPGILPVPAREVRSHAFVGVDYDLDPDAYTEKGLGEDALETVLAQRRALLQTAVTLEVRSQRQVRGDLHQADVVVRNNLLGHSFPTGFAFARQFWLEVTATDGAGNPVCLLAPDPLSEVPCGSGVIGGPDELVPQCDPVGIAAVFGGSRFDIPNGQIDFAAPLPVGECDPWLANFQKILTDGDPDGDGVFREVAYQSFLPNLVQDRLRMVGGQPMVPLQSVRLAEQDGQLADASATVLPYLFDTSRLPDGEPVTVTATLRFRHLPPEFIRALDAELDGLPDVPEEARIDPEELIDRLAVTDVVTASSGQGPVLACEGPQNREGASLLDCVTELEGDDRVVQAGGPGWSTAAGLAGAGSGLALAAALGAVVRRPFRRRGGTGLLRRAEWAVLAAVVAAALVIATLVTG